MARFFLRNDGWLGQVARHLAGWFFATMSFAIPVNRLQESQGWIAFYHPNPGYPLHILLVPKKAIADPTELDTGDTSLMAELFEMVQALVAQFDLQKRGYRLITDGGPYQSIPQLHFHLISEK
jgi:histidine triad (HIT) family protein